MSARGRIIERFERSRRERNGVRRYRKVELLKIALIRTENDGGTIEFTKQPKIREEVMILPKSGEGIRKNGREITKMREEKNIGKMKTTFNDSIAKALDLSKEDISATKKLNATYYLGLFVGVTILAYTIVFYQSLGLMVAPMFILGLGLVFTWLASKWKINKIRKKHVI